MEGLSSPGDSQNKQTKNTPGNCLVYIKKSYVFSFILAPYDKLINILPWMLLSPQLQHRRRIGRLLPREPRLSGSSGLVHIRSRQEHACARIAVTPQRQRMVRIAGSPRRRHKPLRPLHGFEIERYAVLPESRRTISRYSIASVSSSSVHWTTTRSRRGPRRRRRLGRRRQLALVSPTGEAEDAREVHGELLHVNGGMATVGRRIVDGVGNADVRQDLARQQPVEVVQLRHAAEIGHG